MEEIRGAGTFLLFLGLDGIFLDLEKFLGLRFLNWARIITF